MIMLGTIGAALAVRHWRFNRMWGSLALGFIAFVLSDAFYLIKVADGTYVVGTIIDTGWLLGGICFAAAAWQPVEQPTAERRRRTTLLLPAAFGATSLFLLIWDHFAQLTTAALLLSSASVLAVLVRMTLTLAENRRMVTRLREEAQALSMKNEELLEVDALKEALRQSQKMDALGQLAGGVAHDFNNLLTVIYGYATLLQPDVDGNPEASRKIEAITTATERANDLTRQLLTFSPRQVVQTSHVDLNESVLETKALISSVLGDDIELDLRLADGLPPILADAGKISQVLVNLVLNARDAMPVGGTVAIATASTRIEDDAMSATGRAASTRCSPSRIRAAASIPRHRPGSSSPSSRRRARTDRGSASPSCTASSEGCGGSITVDSVVGAGSTFSVVFPAAPPASSISPSDAAGHGTPTSQRVLLVEDERAVRELLVEQLEAMGHHVVAAPTPARACEIYEQSPEDFDLVVTDVVMPGMDGWALTTRLRAERPSLPVVLISGYTDGAVDPRDLSGATAFLMKPFGMDALAENIQAVVDQQLDPAVLSPS